MKQAFLVIVLFTIVQRLLELRLSHRNEKTIVEQGGHVVPEINYLFMVLMHSTWLLSIVISIYFGWAEYHIEYFVPGMVLFVLGQVFRIVAIITLRKRWTTRIVILPKAPAVSGGIFKYFRHPNYLGVCLEIFALPFMAGLIPIALVFSILNLLILKVRIEKEESSLKLHNEYSKVFNLAKDLSESSNS